MCVGWFEISRSVVKHVQSIGIIRAFVCLGGLVKILSAWGTEEIGGLWFAKGDQYPGWHYVINLRKITSRDWKILAGGSGVAIK